MEIRRNRFDLLEYTYMLVLVCSGITGVNTTVCTDRTAVNDFNHAYIGCFIDSPDRILNEHRYDDHHLTTDKCIQYCFQHGSILAGTQYSSECFCANHIDMTKLTTDDTCSLLCGGNQSEICGGTWRMSVYITVFIVTTTITPESTTTTTDTIETTTSSTTITDSREITTYLTTTAGRTTSENKKCAESCPHQGYPLSVVIGPHLVSVIIIIVLVVANMVLYRRSLVRMKQPKRTDAVHYDNLDISCVESPVYAISGTTGS